MAYVYESTGTEFTMILVLLINDKSTCIIKMGTFFFTAYEILVVTGDKTGAGTNANAFVTIFGKSGITQKISLKKEGKSEFKPNSSAIFKTKANCVGPMRKIRLEHDNTGIMPGWFVERVGFTCFILI